MVSTLEKDQVRICLMAPDYKVKAGDYVIRLKRFISVPVGKALLGRVVDSLGRTLDGFGQLQRKKIKKISNREIKLNAKRIKRRILSVFRA